ncbi:MAG: hypothetical protein QJR02_00645 [Sinobacteraceae bacterium]|nr:hypothetical protein [Nevskiaceae bacterium]
MKRSVESYRSLLHAGLFCAALTLAASSARADKTATAGTLVPGTTIVGERESATGLYLMPWRPEHADAMERPPGILDVPAVPIDAQRFRREDQLYNAGTAYRDAQLDLGR